MSYSGTPESDVLSGNVSQHIGLPHAFQVYGLAFLGFEVVPEECRIS